MRNSAPWSCWAFGLGTLPAMLATGLGAAGIANWVREHHLAAGLAVALLGVATIAMPIDSLLSGSGHGDHSQHGVNQSPQH